MAKKKDGTGRISSQHEEIAKCVDALKKAGYANFVLISCDRESGSVARAWAANNPCELIGAMELIKAEIVATSVDLKVKKEVAP